MSNQNQNTSQEIDMRYVKNQLTGITDSIGIRFVKFIKFLIKNSIAILALIIVGVVVGYFIDSKKAEVYKHEVVIVPNFGSNAYLYEKIKNLKPKEYENILSVEVTPVIDLHHFLSITQNLRIAEFMGQNNVNFTQHKPGSQTEIIYKYHTLTIYTNIEDTDKSIVNNFLSELNQEEYFLKRQEIEKEITSREIEENRLSIDNINTIFEKLGGFAPTTGKSDLNIEMYPEINSLLYSKTNLIDNLSRLEITQFEQSKVFYDVTHISNIKVKSISKAILLPVVLLLLFFLSAFMITSYRRYNAKIS